MTAHVPWYARIIAAVCAAYENCRYLEIGVDQGACLAHVARSCPTVTGVDPVAPERYVPGEFCQTTADGFFARDTRRWDVIFIDGDHSYEQALRDYHHAVAALADNGTIFLHDTWPTEEHHYAPDACGSVYRLRRQLEDRHADAFTFRRHPGLTLVRP